MGFGWAWQGLSDVATSNDATMRLSDRIGNSQTGRYNLFGLSIIKA
jgi:hypothetical protein